MTTMYCNANITCTGAQSRQCDIQELFIVLMKRMRALRSICVASKVVFRGDASDGQVFSNHFHKQYHELHNDNNTITGDCDLICKKNIVEVVSGDAHTLARTDTGRIFLSGARLHVTNDEKKYFCIELESLSDKNIINITEL